MRSKLWIAGAAASLAFAAPAWSAPNEHSAMNVVPASSSIRGTVVCRGVQNVPMTADQEQALPMRLAGHLHCGEEVAIVSDAEGYTVLVRAADGTSGYVARIYLAETAAKPAPAKPVAERRLVEGAASENGIVRWQLGAPGTDRFDYDHVTIESLTSNGITVQVSLQDTGWKLRASVAIANEGAEVVHYKPSSFTLDELKPRLRALRFQVPEVLGKSMTHQVYSTKASAIAPASAVYTNVSYETKRVIVAAPNFLAMNSQQDQTPVLYEGSVAPNEKTAGVVWFERDKNPQDLNLRIFVGDQIFEFPLSFPSHN